jgi:hypothetical protein
MATQRLAAGAYGADVAALHSALKALGFDIPAAEARRNFFGPATAFAVRRLQQQAQLPVTGALDADTARAIESRATASKPAVVSAAGSAEGPARATGAGPPAAEPAARPARTREERRSTASAVRQPKTQTQPQISKLIRVLTTSPSLASNPTLREDLIARYSGFTGTDRAFWAALANDPQFKAIVPELRLTQQLNQLTGDKAALVAAVRAKFQPASLQDLVKLSTADWAAILNTPVDGQPIALPSSVKGATRDEQISQYVQTIIGRLQRRFPAAYIAQAMSAAPTIDASLVRAVVAANPGLDLSKPLPAKPNWNGVDQQQATAALTALRREIIAFPTANYSDWIKGTASQAPANPVRQWASHILSDPGGATFDIRTTPINGDQVPALKQVPATLQPAVTTQLQSVQRLSRLTLDYDKIYVLQSAGKHSSASIARMPQGTFVNSFAQPLGGRATAQTIYSKALSVYTTLVNTHLRVTDALTGVQFGISGDVSSQTQQVLQTIPDLATLFEDMSSCQCDECRAMDGPAAYFVDLMNFLSQSPLDPSDSSGPSALGVLNARRPDLAFLKLNCENSDTELPYIDLVNEILESYVVDGQLDWRTAKNTPAAATTEQLTLGPLNENPDAYEILSAQVYPHSLPFALPLETARVYLAALGTSREQVMQTFRHAGVPSELAIACEYLKISCDTTTVVLTATHLSELSRSVNELLDIPIAFDYANRRLTFWGAMSERQQTLLLALSIDAGYRQAIQELFDFGTVIAGTNSPSAIPARSRITLRSVDLSAARTASSTYSAPLKVLPDGIALSANPIPIRFSPAAKQLIFDGTMSWAQQSILLSMTEEAGFKAAIQSLYQASQHASTGAYFVQLSAEYFGGIVVPGSGIQIPLSYSSGGLNFSGTMTLSQQAILLSLANNLQNPSAVAHYTSAITRLFAMSSQAALGTFSYPWDDASIDLSGNPIPISYSDGTLGIRGAMTNAQRVILLGLSTDPAYQAAVENLYNLGRPSPATPFSVILDTVPTGLAFPQQLASRIAIDPGNPRPLVTGRLGSGELETLANAGITDADVLNSLMPGATVTLKYVPEAVTQYLAISLSFHAESQQLILQAPMSASDQAMLLSLSGDADWIAAINSLAAQSVAGSGSPFSVALAGLPQGLALPGQIASFLVSTSSELQATAGLSRDAQVTLVNLSPNDELWTAQLAWFNTIVQSSPISDLDILTATTGLPTQQFYGLNATALSWSGVEPVEIFLQTVGIAYADLLALLDTQFLNPNQAVTLTVAMATGPGGSPPDPCNLATTSIDGDQIDVNTFFDRAYRFVRLWKKLGWTIAEVDWALSLLAQGDITADVVLQLATIKRIQTKLGLAVDQTLCFWGDLNTSGRKSLYLRLFQNPTIISPVDPYFTLSYSSQKPINSLPQLAYTFPATGHAVTYTPDTGPINFSVAFSEYELAQISAVFPAGSWVGPPPQPGTVAGSFSYSLPNPYPFPDSNVNTIGFSPGSQPGQTASFTLTFVGLMTDGEYAVLKGLSLDSSYQLAIDDLYNLAWIAGVELAAATTTVNASQNSISAHQNTLLAALQISATDLTALLSGASAVPNVLNLSNLSALYRRTTLAHTLGMSVPDLLTLVGLAGVDPFASPGSTLEFIELAQIVQSSNFSVSQLSYIYTNSFTPTSTVAPPLSDVFQLLQGLQTGLQQIAQADTFQPDPKGTRLKQTLTALLPAQLVSQTTGLVNGTQVYAAPYSSTSVSLPQTVQDYLSIPLTYSAAGILTMGSNPAPASWAAQGCYPTADQVTAMTNASPDGDYQAAIAQLLSMASAAAGQSGQYAVPLDTAPVSLTTNPISISFTAGQLSFLGSAAGSNTPMTSDQLAALQSVSSDQNYQTALSALYAASQLSGGATHVPLAALPAGVSLSSNPIQISYAAGQLTFSGSVTGPDTPMTAAQQAVLLGMSSDASFQAAINSLYTASQAGTGPVSVALATLNLSPGMSLSGNPIAMTYGGILTYSGLVTAATTTMTGAQRTILLGLSADASYEAAVNTLFSNSQLSGSPVWTPLTALPAGISLTDNPMPITYTGGQLQFVGAMTGAQQAVLLELAPEDEVWQAAITSLYSMSNYSPGTSPIYATPLAALPAELALPGDLSSLAVVASSPSSSSTQLLQFAGAMTSAAQQTLLAIDPNDPSFASAVGNLWSQPRALITQSLVPALSGFLSSSDAIAALIEAPSTPEARDEYLLKPALAALTQTSSYNLILQTLSSALALDVPTLSWLTQQLLPGFVSGAAGFSAAYFAQATPAGPPALTRNDPVIDFQWGDATPDPSIAGPAFSVDWSGFVTVPNTDSYTFIVQVDLQSTVQLSVNGTAQALTAVVSSPGTFTTSAVTLYQFARCQVELQYSNPGPASGANPVPAAVLLSWSSPSMPSCLAAPNTCLVKPSSMMDDFMALASAGLQGTYVSEPNPSGAPGLERIDPAINFQWGSQTPDPSIPGPGFAATWLGSIMPPQTDVYTFTVNCDAGSQVTLTIDGLSFQLQPVPGTQPNLLASEPISLAGAQTYAIEFGYSHPAPPLAAATAGPQISLSWSSPAIAQNLFSPPTSLAAQDLQLLYRIASLLTTLNTSVDEVQYLQQHGEDFAGTDPNNRATAVPFDLTRLPADIAGYTPALFDQWRRLNATFNLKSSLPPSKVGLFQIFATASQPQVDFSNTLAPVIVAATAWDLNQLQYLCAELGYGAGNFVNEWPLVVVQRCLRLSALAGVSSVKLFEWATVTPDVPQAQDIQNAVKAKYDAATWDSVGAPLADTMRSMRRNALVAYILTLPTIQDAGITDTNGLYEYFLIDVEMAPCMLTSRIVQASAAVQLFVQRCLMNLESPTVPAIAINAEYWSWMQNYRVWQANREVLLYPENYLVPSLRDDMTPLFQNLVNTLQQNAVTDANVTQAYANYLNALNDLSHLDIVGTYWQQDTINQPASSSATPDDNNDSTPIDVLHVFGRTTGAPQQYYYRQLSPLTVQWSCSDYGASSLSATWTPWQPIGANISGDHLIPVVWNNRLFLFWPSFNETSDPAAQTVTSSGMASGSSQPTPTIKELQIGLSWSEYRQGSWTSVQTTPSVNNVTPLGFFAYPAGSLDQSSFAFDSSQSTNSAPGVDGSVIITIDYTAGPWGLNLLASPDFQSTTDWTCGQPNCTFTPISGQGDVPPALPPGPPSPPDPAYAVFAQVSGMVNADQNEPGKGLWFVLSSETQPAAAGESWQASVWAFNGPPQNIYSPTSPYNEIEQGDQQFWVLNSDQQCIIKVEFLDGFGNPTGGASTPFLTGTTYLNFQTGGSWQTGNQPPVVAPAGTQQVHMQVLISFSVKAPPETHLPCVTLSSPSLQMGQVPTQGMFQFSGFPGSISSSGYSSTGQGSYTPSSGAGPPPLPTGLSFDYMSLVGQGTLDTGGEQTPFPLLQNAPAYQLMFPQNAVFGVSLVNNLPAPSFLTTLPFFYSDSTRRYFAMYESFWNDYAFGNLEIFQNFRHPFIGTFLQYFNWGGVPALLTLANQTLSNDGGVLSGLQLSLDESGNVIVGPGSLVAQNQVFTVSPTGSADWVTPPQPTAANTNLYFTSIGQLGFYWDAASRNLGGAFPGSGDACLGSNEEPPANAIISQTNGALQPTNLAFNALNPNIWDLWPPYPLENVDFSVTGAYSIYNWELFFHAPLLVATQLSANQQFQDALTWLEYIFNPTASSPAPSPQRYWNVLPFAADTEPGRIQDLLELMDVQDPTAQQQSELGALEAQIAAYKTDPFDPFAIARLRPMAFMKKTVMAYLDTLIAWGDYLFTQNTRESINEATQVYVLAGQILGPRPVTVPPPEITADLTFNDIQANLDCTSNYWAQMETVFPFTAASASGQSSSGAPQTSGLLPTGNFYFCIPANSQLLAYWDTVADRLYKIRHCQNIAGKAEQLALFAPPINPALLVAATALGVDLDSVLADLNAPAPNYRFTYLLQKALELCAEVRSLGGALLSALEKNDAEALAQLRASQETAVLQAVATLKQSQVDEANANAAALQAAQAVANYRQSYYQSLIAAGLSAYETGQLTLLTQSQSLKVVAQFAHMAAGAASSTPDAIAGAAGIASAVALAKEGGSNISQGMSFAAQAIDSGAEVLAYAASMSAIGGQWDRRGQDWGFQAETATLDLAQIAQQLAAANIRVQIATTDYQNQQLQISNSQTIQNFLTGKFTNQQLYSWMSSQLYSVYSQCFQMAYTLAQRAEFCFRFEMGLTTSNYVQYGYWDSLHKGLLAGEGLYSALKSMEAAYLDQNVREYEISKSVSLALLDPLGLITLKETGLCFIALPEALFDLDYPGHYLRRLKSVSLTIPCVAGPYTSVNATLTLLTNKIRWNPSGTLYPENPLGGDPRFIYDLSATESIATSSAQNDSGMFEVNFREERYLPFEGRGAISTWQLELPLDCNSFDPETITDVVLNLRYTARNGGSGLQAAARASRSLPKAPNQGAASPVSGSQPSPQQNLARFFSLKHEFPTEWYKLFLSLVSSTQDASNSSGSTLTTTLPLSVERFPFQYRGMKIKISSIDIAFRFKDFYLPETGLTSTPLADFTSSGAQLSAGFSPPGPLPGLQTSQQASSVPLPCSPTLNGIPFGSWQAATGTAARPGVWLFQILVPPGLPPSLTDANGNLSPAVVLDIYLACHYAAT